MPLEYRQCAGLAYVIKNRIDHQRRKVGGTKTKRLPMSERIYALMALPVKAYLCLIHTLLQLIRKNNKIGQDTDFSISYPIFVAGVGPEPTTSGL